MAKSSRGRSKKSSGNHGNKRSSKLGDASLKKKARRTTLVNCIRRPGRLARKRRNSN